MIWDTSIWRLGCSNASKIRSAQKCYPCLRYELSPMSPGRTASRWSREWELNPRPADYESAALPLSYLGILLKINYLLISVAWLGPKIHRRFIVPRNVSPPWPSPHANRSNPQCYNARTWTRSDAPKSSWRCFAERRIE